MKPEHVRDMMTDTVHTIHPDQDLVDLRALLYDHDIRHVPVVDGDGDLVGLVSERDLLRNVLTDQADVPLSVRDQAMKARKVREIMTEDVQTADPEGTLQEAAQLLIDNKFGCLPVTEGSRLVGILTQSDFVRHFAEM